MGIEVVSVSVTTFSFLTFLFLTVTVFALLDVWLEIVVVEDFLDVLYFLAVVDLEELAVSFSLSSLGITKVSDYFNSVAWHVISSSDKLPDIPPPGSVPVRNRVSYDSFLNEDGPLLSSSPIREFVDNSVEPSIILLSSNDNIIYISDFIFPYIGCFPFLFSLYEKLDISW